jgi:outer membrane protein
MKRFHPIVLLFCSMMAMLTPVYAQETATNSQQAFSAKEAVDYAMQNQNRVAKARLDQLKQLAINKEVSGLALPQISANGQVQDNPIIQKQLLDASNFDPSLPKGTLVPFAFGLRYNAVGNVNLSQVLFDPSVFVALQARRTLEQLANLNVKMSETEVKSEVYKAYYNVLAADKAIAMLSENLIRLDKTLQETKAIYEAGLAEKLDVDRLSVQINNMRTQHTSLQNMREVGVAALKYQMGLDIQAPITLTDTLSTQELKAVLEDGTNFQLEDRVEYQLATKQMEANSYNLKRYQLQGLPSLSLFSQAGVSRASNEFDYFKARLWYGYVSYGLNLSIPIFSGNQRRRKVDQAWIEVEKARIDMKMARDGISLEQTNSTTTLRNAIRNLESQEGNMKLAAEVLRISNIKYNEGVGSSIEVISAESELLNSQNNYFNALFEAMIARIDYLKAYGKL